MFLVCVRLSPFPVLTLILSLDRPPYLYFPSSSRFIRHDKIKMIQFTRERYCRYSRRPGHMSNLRLPFGLETLLSDILYTIYNDFPSIPQFQVSSKMSFPPNSYQF
jgi:hypothetical protein